MKKAILLLLMLSLLQVSCNTGNSERYTYLPPENVNDEFTAGTLKEVNMDVLKIEKAINKIRQGKFKEVHSILIYKDDKLVLEEYFKGHQYKWDAPGYFGEMVQWNRNMLHPTMSCSKSFTSACIGIAIDKGFIKSVHQSIFDYLPDHQSLKVDNKEYITIEHLLTMTSGLAWDEWSAPHGTAANDIDRLYFECPDPITCVLEKPWWREPGQLFTYNGGGIIILGEIIKNASGLNIDEFSKQYLFDPLGINHSEWSKFPNGLYETAGSLQLTPRDMMKLGVTYLDDGIWNGTRILPKDWVKKSSTIYNNNAGINLPIEDSGKNGYGYTWWISELSHQGKKIKMYRANGWGGQVIMVFPDLDMVVVFTGGNYTIRSSLFKIVKKYILPVID